ncbi:MAG: beta-N-acetylhexosaminidase [Eubacterium sp.]|nr:beta-N-acetylhexosaminidase [Eubacterium sp.]
MLQIIPYPKYVVEKDGVFTPERYLKIKSDFDLPLLKDYFSFSDTASIKVIKDDEMSKEGYKLSVSENEIIILASTKTGAYYAFQTLKMISENDLGKREIPCCEIEDEPYFSWRGINVDESRHFFGEEQIKKIIDYMFSIKLNVLHWHLTDDNGWRIEIKKYPLLTEIGSKRSYTHIGGWKSFKFEKKPHSGFYTQEQIKDIIAYASERGIEIVPEIDFPAHSISAMAAYPWLSCFEEKQEVVGYFSWNYPKYKSLNFRANKTLCLGKEEVYEFVFSVLDEVCSLFDSDYIHIGGDEAPHSEWKRCEKCQSVIKENNLKDETELQGYFENRVFAFLKEKEKTPIGWNEIASANNLDTNNKKAVIQYWTVKRDKNAESYVNSGGSMILSNHQSFYMDMPYARYPLSNTYNYDPADYGVNNENLKNVLGVEGEFWSEWIRDKKKLEMQMFPRIYALSEVGWLPKDKRDYENFKTRWNSKKPLLEQQNINFAEDEIAYAENKRTSKKIVYKFTHGNPYLEVELNDKYKAQRRNKNEI